MSFDKTPIFENKPDATYAYALAQTVLGAAQSGPAVKFVIWCFRLHEQKTLDLDDAEFKILYDAIETSRTAAIIKGQLLRRLDDAKYASTQAEKANK